MREINEQEFRSQVNSQGKPLAIFLYTPLCGTCKATRRMLEVAEHLLPDEILLEANVNMMPQVAQEYKIKSVPALFLMDVDRKSQSIHYRMGSVEDLLYAIRSVIE